MAFAREGAYDPAATRAALAAARRAGLGAGRWPATPATRPG